MDINKIIGMRVYNNQTHSIGVIKSINGNSITVDYHGDVIRYPYPAVFSSFLELEDEYLQEEIQSEGDEALFSSFRNKYKRALEHEINYLKATGGKKQKIVDGIRLSSKRDEYLYAFDTDTDFHFPDGTAIKLWFPDNIVTAYVVSCEDFTLTIRTMEYIGESVNYVEFTSEQWQLLEELKNRLDEMYAMEGALAYEVACNGKKQIVQWQGIKCGQNAAFNHAISEKITFIWGPPGTGKTETLANIALEHIKNGNRVLMLSYSNVSVDGALLRVAKKADFSVGKIVRYGYPRTKELIDNKVLTSYQNVLAKNPALAAEYNELLEIKKKLKKKDPERVKINKRLSAIRSQLSDQEKALIQKSAFVATTVSKATVDAAVYMQKFDVVIFDEASMAYVPQIVFAAGLAKTHFVCLGDFCQLPAIVQNNTEEQLGMDIFDYTGITTSVNCDQGHKWLVMLDLQYRMHEDIAEFVNWNMYHGKLKTSEKIGESREEIASRNPRPGAAMTLMDISGMYSVCTKTMDGSRINLMSALFCIRLAEQNIDKYEVGIITPYSAQSRLILSMIRDNQQKDDRWKKVSCATVHQFQGSEKPIIIYDAVDCFRMPYPGMLLTSLKNDTANRLFNVAVTRAKGKFILVANVDYLQRKNISKKLMFTKAMKQIILDKNSINGYFVLDELMPASEENPLVYIEDRRTSWKRYIDDLKAAKKIISIDLPDVIEDDDKLLKELSRILFDKDNKNIDINIRVQEEIDIPNCLVKYKKTSKYITTPVTIIDDVVWFGQPLYAADFISEGEILDTEYFPCMRFKGNYATRSVKAFLEI